MDRSARHAERLIARQYGPPPTPAPARGVRPAPTLSIDPVTEFVVVDGEFGAPHNGPNAISSFFTKIRDLLHKFADLIGLNSVSNYYPDFDEPSSRRTKS